LDSTGDRGRFRFLRQELSGQPALRLSAGVKSFLFEVQPNDVGIFAAALGVLACAGLLASALPARRAASVDPLVALRSE